MSKREIVRCMCVRERESKVNVCNRERVRCMCVREIVSSMCVCVCVWVRERERVRCMCVYEREGDSLHTRRRMTL